MPTHRQGVHRPLLDEAGTKEVSEEPEDVKDTDS